ncbi:MAG: lysine decarboxylase, partial [Cyanophyceae cyanobacterium]
LPPVSLPALSPRTAYFAPLKTVPLESAVGRISAELVCPYPPGIPTLMPGETISAEALTYLQQVLTTGSSITGCSDSTLKTFQVVSL